MTILARPRRTSCPSKPVPPTPPSPPPGDCGKRSTNTIGARAWAAEELSWNTARNIAQGEFVTGSATFEVIADPSGRIRTVRLQNASRDKDGWERFAEELHKGQATGIRTPEGAHSVWTILYVSAENELTSGQNSWWSPASPSRSMSPTSARGESEPSPREF